VEYGAQFDQYHGKGLESLFPEGGAPMTTAPFPRASRRKDVKDYEQEKVHAALRSPTQQTEHIDPRQLHSTQPNVTRAGVSYYMGSEYQKTGKTFADPHDPGNRLPVVYSRKPCADCPETHMLLSGHHRATAALLQGEQLAHVRVRGGFGGPRR
jgi:hypothetical protein